MARKLTIFQNLNNAFSGNWDSMQPHVNSYDMSNIDPQILYKTTDKADYDSKKLELKQNKYLKDRWVKANVDLSVTAYSGLNNVKLMYRDCDLMDAFPEIGAALDIVSEESSVPGDNGQIVNVSSKSERIKAILEDLFVNRLNLQVTAPMIIRAMCKYGNQFMLLDIDSKQGVKGWKQLPVFNVERIENGVMNPYGSGMSMIAGDAAKTDQIDMSTKFVWVDGNNSQVPFRNWQIAHFRLLSNSMYLPYGCLVGNTRIETECGYKEIKDIQIGDRIWTFNIKTQKRELSTVTMWMPKGEKDVYKISTKHNFIEGTLDHKILTYNGNTFEYKEIGKLHVNDFIVTGSREKDAKKAIEIDKTPLPSSRNRGIKWTDNDIKGRRNDDFKLEKVTKIEQCKKQNTYDITINSANSNFFANGIVTHNCSYLNAARRHWRILSLMEDMMLIYRLERSIERRVFKIYVGAIDDADVQAYVENIANNFKRTPIIDPMTGQVDLRKNILSVDNDIFIPVRDQNAPTPIDTLSPAQNLTAIDDIKYIQNKVCTALRIPKAFLNFEDAQGEGKNLALEDIRFTRTVNKIQQAFLMELTKVASIHLYLLGFTDDLSNYNLSMQNPSTQAEQLEIDNLQKKISAARDAISDPGNGIPVMSQSRALKEILKWSDKDIKDNLEEIRLEKALSSELEKTSQIIKRTGIFDIVDRIYGEPNAEYMDDAQQGQDGMGGAGGGGGMPSIGGGGGDFGSDLDSIGQPGEDDNGDIAGTEGAEPTADMDNGSGTASSESNESVHSKKPLLKEDILKKRKSYQKILKESEAKADFLFKKYLDKLSEDSKNKKDTISLEKADIYDKSLLINEEFDKMIKNLDEKLSSDDVDKDE